VLTEGEKFSQESGTTNTQCALRRQYPLAGRLQDMSQNH